MRVLIIDDDQDFIEKIKNDLFYYFCQYYEKTEFIFDIDSLLNVESVDYAFIDIDLPVKNGISVAKELKNKYPKVVLVFISFHSHLVHNTLIVNPFYFIRKMDYQKDLHTFFQLIEEKLDKNIVIDLCFNREKYRVLTRDILYIESQIHKLLVYTKNGIYYDNHSLKTFFSLLPQEDFVQIHRSFIINVNYLTCIKSNQIILDNSVSLTVGRAYKEDFEIFYKDYLLK